MPTYVITGTSAGIGLEMTKQLVARGDTVYALCRTESEALKAVVKAAGDKVKVLTDMDVMKDDIAEKLKSGLAGITIDVVVNNAGSINGLKTSPDWSAKEIMGAQNFETLSLDDMRNCFELNTLGPIRVTKALLPQVKENGGKIIIISTQMGSIADNTSGGLYAYRASKAAVNMVGKGLSSDLKTRGIAVGLVHPGFVATQFAGGENAAKMGAKDVVPSTRGCIEAIDAVSMEKNGEFIGGNCGEGLKDTPW